MNDREVWYRYEAFHEEDTSIVCREYPVGRHTPKGVWISLGPGYGKRREKFVFKNARKRFAYPTKELALAAFETRMKLRLGFLEADIRGVSRVIGLLARGETTMPNEDYVPPY